MLCTFCNAARLDNEASCPYCGAPSPLAAKTNYVYGAMPLSTPWESSPHTPPPVQMSNQAPSATPQTPRTSLQQQPTSLVPVPTQTPMAWQQQPMGIMPTGPMQGEGALVPTPMQDGAPLVPALPNDEGTVYIPPMYTRPRAIIPRYRAISGLLSVLIVSILLCSGVAYYAKASGKITFLRQLYGLVPPQNIHPSPTAPLPDPKTSSETGPAYSIINSAITNSKIDPVSHVSLQPDNVFKPGQPIFLTYSVQHPRTPGYVVIKWYTNKVLYQSSSTRLITDAINGYSSEEFAQPAEGMVELYWNKQLAIRLFFVVR